MQNASSMERIEQVATLWQGFWQGEVAGRLPTMMSGCAKSNWLERVPSQCNIYLPVQRDQHTEPRHSYDKPVASCVLRPNAIGDKPRDMRGYLMVQAE
jgi:hypothetical protein